MKRIYIIITAFLILGISGCTTRAATPTQVNTTAPTQPASLPSAQELTKVTLPVGYIPNVQFAPLYVGIEKGFYRNAGLEVSVDYSMENDNAVLLATGNLQFAILSGEQVLLGRAQGLPLVYTMAWYQQYPVGIVSKAAEGIKTAADLKGKKIGLPGLYGASYIGAMALLYSGGLTEKDVTLDSVGYNQVEVLLADREDAVVVYVTNEPAQLEKLGEQINLLKVSDVLQMVGNGLVTNEQTLRDNPALVKAMSQATIEAIQYTIDHPDEAFEISKKYVPNLDSSDQSIQKQVLMNSIELWKASQIGFSQPQAWVNMQNTLQKMGLMTSPVDLSACYTNEFIP
jgi:NitT/TauT family transport system substrate-binding protein